LDEAEHRTHGLWHVHQRDWPRAGSAVGVLIAAGVPVNVVSARLGHAKTSITSDIYAHVLPGMQQQAAVILGALLAAKK
jgi:integrase